MKQALFGIQSIESSTSPLQPFSITGMTLLRQVGIFHYQHLLDLRQENMMCALIIRVRAINVPNIVLSVMHAKIRKRQIQLNRYAICIYIYTLQCPYLYRYGLELAFYIFLWLPISPMIAAKSKWFPRMMAWPKTLRTSENICWVGQVSKTEEAQGGRLYTHTHTKA